MFVEGFRIKNRAGREPHLIPPLVLSKLCGKCFKIEPHSKYGTHRFNVDGLQSYCRACHTSYYKRARISDPINNMLSSSRCRARLSGLKHSIHYSDIVVPEVCPLLGTPLAYSASKVSPNSPSLDRIDSRLGYIPGNVWVISHRANSIKSNSSLEEFELIAKKWRAKVLP